MLKVGTLFSGGLAAVEWALKYEELEHEILFACEWDKYARKQYLSFHGEPTSNFYEDVSDMNGTQYLNTLDLMVWGSPCQDLSLAGKRKGFDGEKSSLFREGARIMCEVMPKAFIFENVLGLLSSNNGNDYKEVEKTFRDIGYHILLGRINAKEQGTAQNRDRVFIVGFLDVEDYHNFHFADSVPLTKCLRDYLDDEVDEKYYLSQKMIDGFISSGKKHKSKGNGFEWKPKQKDEIANCLRANGALNSSDNSIIEPLLNQVGELDIKGADSTKRVYGVDGLCPTMTTMGGGNRQPKVLLPTIEVGVKSGQLNVIGNTVPSGHQAGKVYDIDGICPTVMHNNNKVVQISVKSATVCGYEVATENDSINFTHPNSTTRRGRVGKGVAQTLDCACNQGVIEPMMYDDYNDNLRTDGLCGTITSNIGASAPRNGQKLIYPFEKSWRIRRLTPKECFRLMGMKDEDIELVNSDTQSYKIAGNGIEINTMRSIVRQLYKPVKSVGSLF